MLSSSTRFKSKHTKIAFLGWTYVFEALLDDRPAWLAPDDYRNQEYVPKGFSANIMCLDTPLLAAKENKERLPLLPRQTECS